MSALRRPFAFFTALLVWLTAVSSTGVAASAERRILSATGDGVPAVSVALPRSTAFVVRDTTRGPSVSHDAPPALPAPQLQLAESNAVRHAPAMHARARREQGLARTYDAMAPPQAR